MSDSAIEVKIEEFPILKALGSPIIVSKEISKQYNLAGRRVGASLAAQMRKVIQGGVSPANHPFTSAFKRGSTKPLVDEGRLFKAITWNITGASDRNNRIEIGVMRSNAAANVAKIVHDGAQITVTPRMSMLFKVVLAASMGRGTVRTPRARELLDKFNDSPVGPPTVGTILTIPPRPFALAVLNNPATRDLIVKEYSAALSRAMIALGK